MLRPTVKTIGRVGFWENLFRAVFQWRRSSVQGSQRPIAMGSATSIKRNYDLEISEYPVRDCDRARALIEMAEYSTEVRTCVRILVEDIFSSEDGDDQGFQVSDTLNNDETPVDPQVKEIIDELIAKPDVIGGLSLTTTAARLLLYGDAFLSIGIDRDRRGGYSVSRTLLLPTWEMFRIETDNGELLGFEQRKWITDPDPLRFSPPQIIHFRHDRKSLYGTSIWYASIGDWNELKERQNDYRNASRAVGVNANVHIMPEGTSIEQLQAYREAYEAELAEGAVCDHYIGAGGQIQKLSNLNPDLSALSEAVTQSRTKLLMPSLIPAWRFVGLDAQSGNKDISGQPAKAYARRINALRQIITEGIKQIIDTELILRMGEQAWLERGQYQIVWPDILVDPMAGAMAAPDTQKEEPNGTQEAQPPNNPEPNPTAEYSRNGRSKTLGDAALSYSGFAPVN